MPPKVSNLKCPRCGSVKFWKKGKVPTITGPRTRYVCLLCAKTFYATGVRKSRKKA